MINDHFGESSKGEESNVAAPRDKEREKTVEPRGSMALAEDEADVNSKLQIADEGDTEYNIQQISKEG